MTQTKEMLSEHFSKKEMACKDCGECALDPLLVPALEELRALANAPVHIHDACRCAKHNAAVGGVSKSQHIFGGDTPEHELCTAADLSITGKTLHEMYDLALQVPAFKAGGIGVYDTGFIHVDVRPKMARWARVEGKYRGIADSQLIRETEA